MTTEARLAGPADIAGFRAEAHQLLSHQVPPDAVRWIVPAQFVRNWPHADPCATPAATTRSTSAIVPGSFVRLCDYVVQHRDNDRFALLYRLLWRLVHEPGLRHDPADHDMARAQHMAHSVRRDIHKIKATLRFRDVPDPSHPDDPLQMAWCDPAHHILETVAQSLARRNAAIRWVVFTPGCGVLWDRDELHYVPCNHAPLAVSTDDARWLDRWQELFAVA